MSDPRCISAWYKEATHDYEIIDRQILRNTTAEAVLGRMTNTGGYSPEEIFKVTAPKLVTTFKCKLCGVIRQTEHQ